MATQVPYSPIPQVSARDEPTPYRSEAIPSGAFGQPQAQARIQEGQTLGQVGNELYARAIAIQEFNQQAEANEKDAAFQQQQIQAFTDYSQKMGKDAADGLPGFMADQERIRQQMGAGLSPYGQVLYNNQTRNAYNRMAFSAAVHAKDEQKKYVVAGFQAQRDAAGNNLLADPNPANFDANMRTVEEAAKQQAKIQHGFEEGSDQYKQYVQNAKSEAAGKFLMGMGKSQAAAGLKMLDKLEKDGTVIDEGARLRNYLTNQLHSVASRVASNDVLAGKGWGFEGKKLPMDVAEATIGGNESSGNWIGYHSFVPGNSQHPDGYALGRYGIMTYNLSPWLKEAGMPDMTPDQFIADHDAQKQLFQFKFGQLQEKNGSFEGALRDWFGHGKSDGHMTWEAYRDKAFAYAAQHSSPKDIADTAETYAKTQSNDPEYVRRVRDDTIAEYDHMQTVRKVDELNHWGKMEDMLAPQQDGKMFRTEEELTADPDRKAVFESLSPQHREAVRAKLRANDKNGGFAPTPESEAQFNELMGIASDPSRSPEDAKKLLDFDTLSWKAPSYYTKPILAAQAKIFKGFTADPQVGKAMSEVEDILDDAGINKSSAAAKSDYYRFRGTFERVMKEYIQDKGHPPDVNEQRAMASRLIQQIPSTGLPLYQGGKPGILYWGDKPMGYNPGVPDKAAAAITQRYRQQYGADPQPEEIQSIYNAAVYREQFGKKPAPTPPGPSFGGPR